MTARTVAIAGAGIGGLTAGLAFLKKGWNVRIYEQSSDIRILGASIYIWENGLRVLEALGIAPEHGVLRLSFVHYTSPEEIDRLVAALERELP